MKEDFLYYIWQHQFFNKTQLITVDGQSLTVVKPGYRNLNNGPDFKEAHIRLNDLDWYGDVEMHVRSSDWFKHKHQGDVHFDSVMLHVVLIDDRPVITSDGMNLPTLEVKGVYKPKVYHRYMSLLEHVGKIPCEDQLQTIPVLHRIVMAERVLIERLKRKSAHIFELLKETNGNWQEVTFLKMSEALGFKVNTNAMLELAKNVGYKRLLKGQTLHQKSAILIGSAGFLTNNLKDDYLVRLKKEYSFQKSRLKLAGELPIQLWKFSPLRPFNYPTQRIAQLAALTHEIPNLWDAFLNFEDVGLLISKMEVIPEDYWLSHFRPDKRTERTIKGLSKSAIIHLLINVTAPLLVAFAIYTDDEKYIQKAMNLLSSLPKESNRVNRLWSELNWQVSSAFDSQALTELFNEYCSAKKCLTCHVGHQLIKAES